jgi:hypothetical protein
MKRGLVNLSLVLLMASVLGMMFSSASSSTTGSNNLQFARASTEGGEGGDGSEDSGGSEEGGGDDSEPEPDPEPGPEPEPEPEPEPAPIVPEPIVPLPPVIPEEPPIVPEEPDISQPGCQPNEVHIPEDGDCDGDIDPEFGGPPDPEPPEKPCDPATDKNCDPNECPEPIPQGVQDPCGEPKCKDGYELINGKCEEKDEDRDRVKIIVKNIDITKVVHTHNNFPEVDIIGLSISDSGDAMVCMMEIDNSRIQCQEFAVPNDRINQNIWRVIETDHSKDYDNGNTGSNEIDNAIQEIREQQFNELEDRNNHDFGVDLAAVGINPVGDGLICLINDPEGTALCEPFKVSSEAISGQITEITEIDA